MNSGKKRNRMLCSGITTTLEKNS
uniref:Uncharacterized protein n=1 Tax=Tetranychus urticae TaxID=32264 RepID=T1JWR0_TETUR